MSSRQRAACHWAWGTGRDPAGRNRMVCSLNVVASPLNRLHVLRRNCCQARWHAGTCDVTCKLQRNGVVLFRYSAQGCRNWIL
jgi:hypothetical protein